MQYATTYGALVEFAKIGPDNTVLLTTGSSSIRLAAIQIVKAQKKISIATTRSSAKKQLLVDLKTDHVIATQKENLPTRVSEITDGKLARIAFDAIKKSYIDTLTQAVAPKGTVYLYDLLSKKANYYPINAFFKTISLTGYMMYQMKTPERFDRIKRYMYEHLANNSFKPHINRTYPFEQATNAYQYLKSNQQIGKIIITL